MKQCNDLWWAKGLKDHTNNSLKEVNRLFNANKTRGYILDFINEIELEENDDVCNVTLNATFHKIAEERSNE